MEVVARALEAQARGAWAPPFPEPRGPYTGRSGKANLVSSASWKPGGTLQIMDTGTLMAEKTP